MLNIHACRLLLTHRGGIVNVITRVCWLVGSSVRYDRNCDLWTTTTRYKTATTSIFMKFASDVHHLCQMSVLTFGRLRPMFKVIFVLFTVMTRRSRKQVDVLCCVTRVIAVTAFGFESNHSVRVCAISVCNCCAMR